MRKIEGILAFDEVMTHAKPSWILDVLPRIEFVPVEHPDENRLVHTSPVAFSLVPPYKQDSLFP